MSKNKGYTDENGEYHPPMSKADAKASVEEMGKFVEFQEEEKLRKENVILKKALRGLINKVNMVTVEWRHHKTVGKVYSDSVVNLYDRQLEAEKVLESVGG